jgi:hypothetical protein
MSTQRYIAANYHLVADRVDSMIGANAMTLRGRHCQCRGCLEYFNSASVFDRHRVGSWANQGRERRYLTVEEIRARGWLKNAAGFWIEKPFTNTRGRTDHSRLSGDQAK